MAGEQTEKEVINRVIKDYNERKTMTIDGAIQRIENFLIKLNQVDDEFKFATQKRAMLENIQETFKEYEFELKLNKKGKFKLKTPGAYAKIKDDKKAGQYNTMITTLNRFSQAAQIIQNKSLETQENITKQKLVIEGYALINTITETIRNQEVIYDITYIDDIDGNKQITTLRMNLEQLLQKYISVNNAGEMRINTAAVKNNIGAGSSWSQTRIENYQTLLDAVKEVEAAVTDDSDYIWGNRNKNVKDINSIYVNEGNIMEAFRYAELYNSSIFKNHTHSQIRELLKQIQRNTVAFSHGGDITYKEADEIFDIQLKNANASVTDLNTVFNIVMRLYDQLQTAKSKQENEGNTELSKLNGQIRSAINETLDNLRKEIKGSK